MTRLKQADTRFIRSVAIVAMAMLVAGGALAASADRQAEAQIDAGHWVDDPEKGVQIFSKGVTLDQGSLHVEAERATVYRDGQGGFNRIVLEGEPARWREIMDDGSELRAQARSIDYQLSDEMVVLREQVIVNKQRDEISGELIRYNLKTQRLDAGTDGDSRVRIRFTPTRDGDSAQPEDNQDND